MQKCKCHSLRWRLTKIWTGTILPVLLSGLVEERADTSHKSDPAFGTIGDQIRRNFGYILGSSRVAAIKKDFQEAFIDRLNEEDAAVVLGFNVLPEAFVLWSESGHEDFLEGLERIWGDMHDFHKYPSPYSPWIIVFLDSREADSKYRNVRGTFNGMNVYLQMFGTCSHK